jgi:hypothetical protein
MNKFVVAKRVVSVKTKSTVDCTTRWVMQLCLIVRHSYSLSFQILSITCQKCSRRSGSGRSIRLLIVFLV